MPSRRLVVCLILWAAACGEGGEIAVPIEDVSFSGQVQPIFSANCVSLGCHVGPNPQVGMDLSAGQAITNIVGVQAVQTSLLRVAAGRSSDSYLYQKISGGQLAAGGSGDRMPPPPRSALNDDEIATIRAWIDEGALNN